MSLRTTVEQLAVAEGRRYGQAHGALAVEPTSRFSRGRGRGSLYILVEVSGSLRDQDLVADRLAELIRDIYYEQRGSITAALREAIRNVNNMLADENRQSMPDQQWTAGLSCAVLRNQDLFVAQAGPAALYVGHERQVVRFPDISPWLDNIPPEDADAAPLGKRRDVHVDLFHTQVSENDTILLVDSRLASRLSPQAWPRIMTRPSVAEVLLELSGEAQGSDLSAMAVRLGDGETDQSTTQATMLAEAPEIGVPAPVPAQASPPMDQVAAPPLAPADTRPDKAAIRPARPTGRPLPPPLPTDQRQVPGWGEQFGLGERAQSVGLALAAIWAALLVFLKSLVPSQVKPRTASTEPAPAAKPPVQRAEKRTKTAPAGRTRSLVVQRLLVGIAVAIPLIVAGLVIWTVIQRGEAQQSEVDTLWLSANTSWRQAQELSEPTALRDRLAEADQYLNQLLEEQPGHAEALDLRRRIKARLEESSQVRLVPWEGELMTYAPGAKLNRVVVQGVHVFVMDRKTNQVHHHQLDEFQQSLLPASDSLLVQKGDRVKDLLVADLLDMAWMPAGNGRQKAGLLILESGGNLLEYDPVSDELVPLQVASESWKFPQLVGSHSGRFYLLDSVANHIWRYLPSADGYTSRPDEWLETEVDLAGVRDMAIGDDILLLYADGAIQKLSGGKPVAFDISDWDTPPQGATAIFARPPNDTQWVYVADPGNNRIVQASKDGQFKRQFRLAETQGEGANDALASVTSLFVDEIGGRAFFLSDNSLHMIILPSD